MAGTMNRGQYAGVTLTQLSMLTALGTITTAIGLLTALDTGEFKELPERFGPKYGFLFEIVGSAATGAALGNIINLASNADRTKTQWAATAASIWEAAGIWTVITQAKQIAEHIAPLFKDALIPFGVSDLGFALCMVPNLIVGIVMANQARNAYNAILDEDKPGHKFERNMKMYPALAFSFLLANFIPFAITGTSRWFGIPTGIAAASLFVHTLMSLGMTTKSYFKPADHPVRPGYERRGSGSGDKFSLPETGERTDPVADEFGAAPPALGGFSTQPFLSVEERLATAAPLPEEGNPVAQYEAPSVVNLNPLVAAAAQGDASPVAARVTSPVAASADTGARAARVAAMDTAPTSLAVRAVHDLEAADSPVQRVAASTPNGTQVDAAV